MHSQGSDSVSSPVEATLALLLLVLRVVCNFILHCVGKFQHTSGSHACTAPLSIAFGVQFHSAFCCGLGTALHGSTQEGSFSLALQMLSGGALASCCTARPWTELNEPMNVILKVLLMKLRVCLIRTSEVECIGHILERVVTVA